MNIKMYPMVLMSLVLVVVSAAPPSPAVHKSHLPLQSNENNGMKIWYNFDPDDLIELKGEQEYIPMKEINNGMTKLSVCGRLTSDEDDGILQIKFSSIQEQDSDYKLSFDARIYMMDSDNGYYLFPFHALISNLDPESNWMSTVSLKTLEKRLLTWSLKLIFNI